MPSGARKRKAAKKKKELQSNHVNGEKDLKMHDEKDSDEGLTTMIGEKDLKMHDEKDSDEGEVNSPVSQAEGEHQHPFTESEKVEVDKGEDSSFVQSIDSEGKSVQETKVEGGVIQINWEPTPEEDSESRNGDIQPANGFAKGSSSSSSGSSCSRSDEEPNFVAKEITVQETAPSIDSLPEKVTQADDALKGENTSLVDRKPIDSLSEVAPQVLETALISNADNGVLLDGTASVGNGLTSGISESISNANEGKEGPSDVHNGDSPVITELDANKDNAVSKSDEITATSSESNDYLSTSTFVNGSVSAENGAEPVNETAAPQGTLTQPLIASAPRTAQKTSWMGCCGVLELFTGSNR